MKNKKALVALCGLLVLAIVLGVVYFVTREKPVEGGKTVTVQIVYDDVDKEVKLQTEEEFLLGALQEKELVDGADFGGFYMITTVDGRAADDAKQEWWAITKGGEMTEVGAAELALADGDHYELTLTEGW